jgi:carboxymethylenebutenolidase
VTTRHILSTGLPVNEAGNKDSPLAIIVLQEAFGVNDHIRDVTDRFATEGYFAVAPELFHRENSPEVAYDDFPSALSALGALSRDDLGSDLSDTSNYLQSLGFAPSNTAIVGYCMGGTVATFANTLGLVGASASFYGGGVSAGRFGLPSMIDMVRDLTAPWIGLYGQLDKGIPHEQVEALSSALSHSSHATILHYYPEADHGFHSDDRHPVYNKAVATAAARETLDFFAQHLSRR